MNNHFGHKSGEHYVRQSSPTPIRNVGPGTHANGRRATHDSLGAKSSYSRAHKKYSQYQPSLNNPKKSHKKLFIILAIVAVLIGAGAFALTRVFTFGDEINQNMAADGTQVLVYIPSGSSNKDIADELFNQGLIRQRSEFSNLAKLQNKAGKLQAGTYLITAGTSVQDILDMICAGKVATFTVTVPEGTYARDIATIVETASAGTISADAFTLAISDASVWADEFSFVAEAGNNSLEGFLYPETYSVPLNSTAEDVVRLMLNQFEKVTDTLDFSYPTSKGLSLYQALNLASIVQRESTTDIMTHVAGVFYNRLANDGAPTYGYLESDATTAYVVNGEPTAEQVHSKDPYSTYTNKGLPPTPICNPGLDALQAVCAPLECSDYYFFTYYDKNGTAVTIFNETMAAHERDVAKYL